MQLPHSVYSLDFVRLVCGCTYCLRLYFLLPPFYRLQPPSSASPHRSCRYSQPRCCSLRTSIHDISVSLLPLLSLTASTTRPTTAVPSYLLSSPGMKKASAILSSDDDSYMMTPCSSAAKYVIVQLKEDILLDLVELVNREHYSSSIQHFSLYGSNVYPTDEWVSLGRFWADETQQAQYWRLDAGDYAVRYVKLIWETWWKDEYYCTLTQLGVYGRSVLEAFREDLDDSAEVLREVEQVLIEHNLAKEADTERREAKDAETAKDGGQTGAESDVIALTETAIELSASPSTTADSASYLWDVVAFWRHQPSVDPVISQLMGIDEPPNIIVTAHSQSAATNGRLSIASPTYANTDVDKLFSQPVCPSFNVSQPVSLLFPTLHASPAPFITNTPAPITHASNTVIVVTDSDSDGTESQTERESSIETLQTDGQGGTESIADTGDDDTGVQTQTTTVILDPPVVAALTPTPITTASTPASMFSDFIYSQMARLSKQAGAQSQAEAEKIDPHYAALLAKYTGRDKHKSTQAASLPTTVPSAHSIDDSAASTAMPATSVSSIADTVALVSAADVQNKGKSSSHQSIFRTLTNRLKEVELHQALSTHFVSVLSERFGAEIEQLQTTLEKLRHTHVAGAGSDIKAAVLPEDREALREELKDEVGREVHEEMQRILEMQASMEQRLAEMSTASHSLHALLHQELLAVVLLFVLWTVLSSLLPPLPFHAALWYFWRGFRVVAVWSATVVWRVVAWTWRQAMHRWSAGSTTATAPPLKAAHRRSSSADSTRRPSFSTAAVAPANIDKQHSKAIEQSKGNKQQPQQQQQSQPPRHTNGPVPQLQPRSQPQLPRQRIKRKSPPASYAASPQHCTWTLEDSQPPTHRLLSSDDDSLDDSDDTLSSWRVESVDSGSARPHMSPPVNRSSSPRRGSWSGLLVDGSTSTQQQQRSASSVTQPLPSRLPLPPLRPAIPPPSVTRLPAKHRSRTAETANLPSFIHRAMSPPATASVGDTSSSVSAISASTVVIHPYVSHASINSFDVLQSPERRHRPLLVK